VISAAFECPAVLEEVPTNETRMDIAAFHWDRIPCIGPKTKTGREKADVLANAGNRRFSRCIRGSRVLAPDLTSGLRG
jgi:hypothetical protein